MINNTLFILLVILALGEIMFGILCVIWLKRLDKAIDEMNRYTNLTLDLYKINQTATDDISKDFIKISEIMDSNNNVYEKIVEAYDTMNKTYKTMTDAYHAVSDQHSKILEAWQNVEERYSDCFEQYKHTHECLKKCMDLMTPIATEIPESIEELGMKLNDAQEIVSRIDDNTKPISMIVNYPKWNPYDVAPDNQLLKKTEESETDDDYFKSCTDFFNALAEMATEGKTPTDTDAMKELYETNGGWSLLPNQTTISEGVLNNFEETRKKALEDDS